MTFAKGTTVEVERSRSEIERLLKKKYNVVEISTATTDIMAMLQFKMHHRTVRFVVDMPGRDWAVNKVMAGKRCRYYRSQDIPTSLTSQLLDAEHRRRWRCLLLAIKAKLVVVDSGIATFEEEFLSRIVVQNGQTLYENILKLKDGTNDQLLLPPVSQ